VGRINRSLWKCNPRLPRSPHRGPEPRFAGAIALFGALMILSTYRINDFMTE
jgi:hypothetical protein